MSAATKAAGMKTLGLLGGTRPRVESAYAEERAASRWAEFLVDAAFRAAEAAAAQRPIAKPPGQFEVRPAAAVR